MLLSTVDFKWLTYLPLRGSTVFNFCILSTSVVDNVVTLCLTHSVMCCAADFRRCKSFCFCLQTRWRHSRLSVFLAFWLDTRRACVYLWITHSATNLDNQVLHQLWWKGVTTLLWGSRDIRLYSTALLSFVMHSAMPAHWYMPATGQKSSACWSLTVSRRKKETGILWNFFEHWKLWES